MIAKTIERRIHWKLTASRKFTHAQTPIRAMRGFSLVGEFHLLRLLQSKRRQVGLFANF